MMEQRAPEFPSSLNLKLALECDGKKVELLAGNIERLLLKLHSYGFEANLTFSGCDNKELAELFNLKKPTHVTLTFLSLDPTKTDPLLELKGWGSNKQDQKVDRVDHEIEASRVFYKMDVYDNARATWGDHFPTSIYIDKSMKEALEEHKNPKITIKYDFPPLEAKKPITAFSLPLNPSLSKINQPSFYDFAHWYLHQEGGIFSYDYKADSYSILAKKEAKGEAYKIRELWVTPPIGLHPTVPRYNTKIITHTAQNSDVEDQKNEDGYEKVHRDRMSPKGYTIFPGHSPQDTLSILHPAEKELSISTLKFEEDFHIDKLLPGALVGFPMIERSWTKDHQDKVYRVRTTTFLATKMEPPEVQKPIQPYGVSCTSLLELKEETYIERPSYLPPVFPFQIQGTVFCDIGDEKQSTFKITKEKETSQGQYHVVVPLAGKGQTVVIPFLPNMPGHFYFPHDKGQEVLLAMHFRTAEILQAINHQNRVCHPKDIQGTQIVFAYNNDHEHATLGHEFKEGKKSVVTLQQATSDKQTQVITIQDKEILIAVETKDEKSILIQYHSEKGLLISVNDKTGKMTQEIALDGKQMTLTCKNDSDTSTIVQTPDSTTVTTKTFNVKADKILMDAKEDFNCKGGSKVNLEAPVTNAKTKMKIG